MHKDYAKKGSRFKKILVWVFGTCAAVPLTKFVESYYDVSFFSPAISGLWNWLRNVGSWFVRDVSLPFWVVMLMVVLIVLLMVPVAALVYARYEKVEPATADGAPLTDDQNLVFVVVGNAIQQGYQLGFEEVLDHSGLSRIATQNALDHLARVNLIRPVRSRYGGNYADLTPLGRGYFLELEALGKP